MKKLNKIEISKGFYIWSDMVYSPDEHGRYDRKEKRYFYGKDETIFVFITKESYENALNKKKVFT